MLGIASKTDAIEMLKEDHKKVKALFEQFEKTEDKRTKKSIVKKALEELNVHAAIEEELFYPTVRQEMEEEDIMNEADEEHHVAKVLIAELENMSGDESHWEAKFLVLAENVKHHVKEEEGEMFPEAKKTEVDFETLGQEMAARKEQLQSQGVPKPAEAKMVARAQGSGDSPAKNAKRTSARKRH